MHPYKIWLTKRCCREMRSSFSFCGSSGESQKFLLWPTITRLLPVSDTVQSFHLHGEEGCWIRLVCSGGPGCSSRLKQPSNLIKAHVRTSDMALKEPLFWWHGRLCGDSWHQEVELLEQRDGAKFDRKPVIHLVIVLWPLGLTRTLCITEKVGRTIDDLVELLER